MRASDSFSRPRSSPSQPDLALLREIAAAPRPTGGVAIATARAACARELQSLGYDVRERPFVFSEFPGRLATPLFGAIAAMVVGAAGLYGSAGFRWPPAAIMTVGALLLWGGGTWLARRGVLTLPLLRSVGVNLEAVRGAEVPRVWLCAHLDTKSQPIPTLVRSSGIVVLGLGFAGMLAVALATLAGADPAAVWWLVPAALTLAGMVPVVLSMVGTRSPGALDNASGVVTALEAARLLAGAPGIGVLITDAEELGLAGARAWARTSPSATGVVLNCEGMDDTGRVAAMYTGRPPRRLLRAVTRASVECGVLVSLSRMVPGVLADSVAFTDAGLESVTFLRGTVRSLARVHRASDDLAHLSGAGIAEAATLIAATARVLSREND